MKAIALVLPLTFCCQAPVEKAPPRACPLKVDTTKPELLSTQSPIYRNGLKKFLEQVPSNLVRTRSRDFNNGFVSGVRDAHTLFRNAVSASSDGACTLLVREYCPSCPVPSFLDTELEKEGRHESQNRLKSTSMASFDAGYHTALDNRTSLFEIEKLPGMVKKATYQKCLKTRQYLDDHGKTVSHSECVLLSQLTFQGTWKIVVETIGRAHPPAQGRRYLRFSK
jgi:hypothetical protein